MTAREWLPIESAPRDGTVIDLWAKGYLYEGDLYDFGRSTGFQWNKQRRRFENLGGDVLRASDCSHWMPLPEPPK